MDLKYIFEQLFPYIIALYLLDCLTYVRKDHLLFVSIFGQHFKLKKPGIRSFGVWPTDRSFICHSLPIFFSIAGLYYKKNNNLPGIEIFEQENFHGILYEEMASVTAEGKLVKINGIVVSDTPSSVTAKHIVALIRDLKAQRASKRTRMIKAFLAEGTNIEKIKRLNPDGSRLFFYLKMLCVLLFANTFITLPLFLYARLPLAFNLFFLLIVMSLNYILIIVLTLFAPKKIYKNKTSKTATILPIVLSPISAMHALRVLTKEIYARFDPLAVAKALMPPDHFRNLMRKELFRISYAKSGIVNEGLREFLNLKEESYHRMLADSGITLQEIFADPEKQDDSADSYCPLCGTEYLAGPDRCHDCGIGLKPFNSPSACKSIPV